MPIKIPLDLPGRAVLEREHVPFILEDRAIRQDIRPLQIVILNLMPDKISTETQLLRALGNTPLQIEITLLHPATHQSRNTSADHLAAFYATFDEIRERKFDGLLVTGAPIEHLPYQEVTYWPELTGIFNWAATSVHSGFFLCWGAMAALQHYNTVPKHSLPQKMSGIYRHKLLEPYAPLLTGFDDRFDVPVSRHTEITAADVARHPDLRVLAASEESGLFIVEDAAHRRTFVLNHLEYDTDTLRQEYERDAKAGFSPPVPHNYFPDNDPTLPPRMTWRAHRSLLFGNWLNAIYDTTPYDMDRIGQAV